ncbi:MAG: dihydroorotate dehydrogenase electron transfer subunit [Clostridia bacterium]|nr:dihydroorotate dehydrogenase electron transfer subunit [Clostridia bacterium]
MKQGIFTLTENRRVAADIYLARLSGDSSAVTAPGQFVNIEIPGLFLRRPFSVCDWEDGGLTIAYRTAGIGTEELRSLRPGAKLDVLTGLGNGFDTAPSGGAPLLVGGGSGISPLLALAKTLSAEGKSVTAILGTASRDGLYLAGEITTAGARVILTTEDGSAGTKGLVTDAMPGIEYTHVYACGPEPMMKAVAEASHSSGQFSFEARMGCGFGACMGCSRMMKNGPKRVCKDGPVFFKEDIIWQTST